jgi:hypothetical protein
MAGPFMPTYTWWRDTHNDTSIAVLQKNCASSARLHDTDRVSGPQRRQPFQRKTWHGGVSIGKNRQQISPEYLPPWVRDVGQGGLENLMTAQKRIAPCNRFLARNRRTGHTQIGPQRA